MKPVISIDPGLAEGVYAASGSGNLVTLSDLSTIADWGNGNGQLNFTADFSALTNLSHLTLTVTFTNTIDNAWGGGSSVSINGQEATFYWYEAPTTAELTIQVTGCLSNVSISGYSCYNN